MGDSSEIKSDDEKREQLLEAVIADYIRACDSGAVLDRREILERNPELADDLRQFFGQRDRMNQMVEPIRGLGDSLTQVVGPGRQLSYVGNYELLQEIARGGMGVVYKARQTTLGRIVAVKMIVAGRLASEDDVKRFQIEAQAAAGLQHPNIVSIHEVGQHEGWHYFSMDFVNGRDLSAILRENLLPSSKAASYVAQMAQAIHYAHQQGTLHRDLKPSNILIDNQDQVRITDFGLATRVEGDSELTRSGQIVGTPSYMPPEQAQGKRSLIGPCSDVYALGAVLYECLTGRPPFRAESVVETIQQVIQTEAASPRLLNPSIPRDLETICLKCLQKEPHRRYGTAQLLADDLMSFLRGDPILARPLSSAERTWRKCRQNPMVTSLIATVAICLIVGTTVSSYFAIEANRRADAEREHRRRADVERGIATAQGHRAVAAQQQSAESLKDALSAVELMLTRVAQERLANVPQMEPVRRELMEDALQFYQKFLKRNNDDPLILRETAGAYRRLGDIYRRLGRNVEAEESYRKAFKIFADLELQSALEPSVRADLSAAHFEVATCYRDMDRSSDGVHHSRLSVEIAERLAKEFPDDAKFVDAWVDAATLLSHAITSTQPDEAEKILRRNLTLAKSRLSVAECNKFLGHLLVDQERFSEAEPVLRKSVEIAEQISIDKPSDHLTQWFLGGNLHALGSALVELGQLEEAESVLGRAVVIFDGLAADYPTGPDYRNSQAWVHHSKVLLLKKLNRLAEAEQAYREMLDRFIALADDFPATAAFARAAIHQQFSFANFFKEMGRTNDAQTLLCEAIVRAEKLAAAIPERLDPWYGGLVRAHLELGQLLAKSGQTEAAELEFQRAVEIQERSENDFRDNRGDRRDIAQRHLQLAEMLADSGRWLDAERISRMAARNFSTLIAEFPLEFALLQNLAKCDLQLARALLGQSRIPEVVAAHQRRADVWRKLASEHPESRNYRYWLAEASFYVAAWSRWSEPTIAENAYREAITQILQLSTEHPDVPLYHRETARYRRDLAELLVASQLDEAESLIREAVVWAANIIATADSDVGARDIAGGTYRILGKVMRARGRFVEVEQALGTAKSIFLKLAEEMPQRHYCESLAQSHSDLADLLVTQGRLREASECYVLCAATWRKLTVDFPESREYRDHLAVVVFAIGSRLHYTEPKGAEAPYREALALREQLLVEQPDDFNAADRVAQTRINLSTLLMELQKFDEAECVLLKVIQWTDGITEQHRAEMNIRYLVGRAHKILGHVLAGQKRFPEAEKAFRSSGSIFSKMADDFPIDIGQLSWFGWTQFALASFLEGQGRTVEAEACVLNSVYKMTAIREKLAAQTPDDPNLRREIAVSFNALAFQLTFYKKFDEADQAYHKARDVMEKLAADYPTEKLYRADLMHSNWRLGDLFQATDRYAEAEAAFGAAIELAPGTPATWLKRAAFYRKRGEVEHALDDYLKVMELEPQNRVVNCNLAGLPDIENELIRIQVWRGKLLAEHGRYEVAAAAYSRAIDLKSQDLEGVWLPLALLQLKMGKTTEYRRLVTNALDRFGTTAEFGVAINLGVLAKLAPGSDDDLAAVLKVVERAISYIPDDGFATAIHAHLLIRTGRAAQGVPILEAIVAAVPDGKGDQRFNLLFLAMGQRQLGRRADALATLRTAENWQFKQFNGWLNQIDFERTRNEVESLLNFED